MNSFSEGTQQIRGTTEMNLKCPFFPYSGGILWHQLVPSPCLALLPQKCCRLPTKKEKKGPEDWLCTLSFSVHAIRARGEQPHHSLLCQVHGPRQTDPLEDQQQQGHLPLKEAFWQTGRIPAKNLSDYGQCERGTKCHLPYFGNFLKSLST